MNLPLKEEKTAANKAANSANTIPQAYSISTLKITATPAVTKVPSASSFHTNFFLVNKGETSATKKAVVLITASAVLTLLM
jgi:hypothetical protein